MGAQRGDAIELMRDHDHGTAFARQLAHTIKRSLLKSMIADGEHLVDDEHVGVHVRSYCEAQSCAHPARITLHWRVDEFLELREGNDVIEPSVDVGARHPHDRSL